MTEIEVIKEWELAQHRAKEYNMELYAGEGLFTLVYGSQKYQFHTLDGVHGYLAGFDDGMEHHQVLIMNLESPFKDADEEHFVPVITDYDMEHQDDE
jgi:hypothetical protein